MFFRLHDLDLYAIFWIGIRGCSSERVSRVVIALFTACDMCVNISSSFLSEKYKNIPIKSVGLGADSGLLAVSPQVT